MSRRPVDVDVVLHDDVDPASAELRDRIAAATGRSPDDLDVAGRKLRLTVQEDQLADLAGLDEVRTVEPAARRRLFNTVARTIVQADVVVGGTAFEGAGQTVAVADTGFDRGSVSDVHPAFSGRVAKLYALGRPGRADDPNGHGTHVAGSVLGDGTSATMGDVRGTAPRARLVLQSLLSAGGGLGGIPVDLHDLFGPPYDDDGARVHTNSWGSVTPGLPYSASSREIDDMVWTHPDLVICFAAGNDGTDANANGVVDPGQIGSEAAAKNCITVGASESARPDFARTYGELWSTDFPAPPVSADRLADDPGGMVAFSSRGPTREGRVKPDVVAPGSCILSTRSRAVAVASTAFGRSSDPLFFFNSGTSMATPLVAGCAAVLREALLAGGVEPTAALVKALLVNGAGELPGQYTPSEAGRSPNTSSGFGLVDLAASVAAVAGRGGAGFREGGALDQGEEDAFTVDVPAGASTVKVTLVWTDPPGAALQNDLDLIVRTGGAERHGNAGETARFDRANNVEQVVW
ncbi:MAG TPA: S8 family serine peptidase, partial [Pseudonocardia sp.]